MVTLSQDSFYRELSEQEIARAERGMFNFDHPDAFDWDLMEEVLSVSLLCIGHYHCGFLLTLFRRSSLARRCRSPCTTSRPTAAWWARSS